jgi:hypothetical protein
MRMTASWFRSPWDLPNTRTWRAIFAPTPGRLASDRLAFALLLANVTGPHQRGLIPTRPSLPPCSGPSQGVGLEWAVRVKDLGDGHP